MSECKGNFEERSPPWHDVTEINNFPFRIKQAVAIRLNLCIPGLGQGFCNTLRCRIGADTGCWSLDTG